MHIAKAGGTALHSAFGHAFDCPEPPHYLDRSNFGSYDDFASWHPDARKRMIFLPESGGFEKNAPYIAGHISLSTIRDHFPGAQVVTVLREPISRLLSSWIFGRASYDEAPDYQGSWGQQLASTPLGELLAAPQFACAVDNGVVRALLCPHPLIPDDGFIAPEHDDELLKEALTLLDSFSAVGVYEDENYISLFEEFLGKKLSVNRENETRFIKNNLTLLFGDISSETFDLFNIRCRLDTAIWEAYCKKYGVDFAHVRSINLLKNTARFSLLLSGFNALREERDYLKRKVDALEQTLITAQRAYAVLTDAVTKKDPPGS
jgi:hypothetical protein